MRFVLEKAEVLDKLAKQGTSIFGHTMDVKGKTYFVVDGIERKRVRA